MIKVQEEVEEEEEASESEIKFKAASIVCRDLSTRPSDSCGSSTQTRLH